MMDSLDGAETLTFSLEDLGDPAEKFGGKEADGSVMGALMAKLLKDLDPRAHERRLRRAFDALGTLGTEADDADGGEGPAGRAAGSIFEPAAERRLSSDAELSVGVEAAADRAA